MVSKAKKESQFAYIQVQNAISKRIPKGRVMRVLSEKEVYGAINEIVQNINLNVSGMSKEEAEEFFQKLEEKIQGR